MALWLPPKVSHELQQRTKENNAVTLSMFDLQYGIVGKWNKENSPLRKLDPMLRIGKAKEKAEAIGVVPGYYHLIRINPNAPTWAVPLHDGNGGFIEPTEALIEMLRRQDLQNPRVQRDKEKAKADAEAAADRDDQNRHEGRVDNMMSNWRAIARPSILVSDVKWSNRAAGKRGRKVESSS
jgi:hypothetical protein